MYGMKAEKNHKAKINEVRPAGRQFFPSAMPFLLSTLEFLFHLHLSLSIIRHFSPRQNSTERGRERKRDPNTQHHSNRERTKSQADKYIYAYIGIYI